MAPKATVACRSAFHRAGHSVQHNEVAYLARRAAAATILAQRASPTPRPCRSTAPWPRPTSILADLDPLRRAGAYAGGPPGDLMP